MSFRSSNLTFLLMLFIIGGAEGQQPHPSPAAPAFKAPEHPMTEAQVRLFFEVCHTSAANRALAHEKLEQERQQLPAWYPRSVWDEIENSIENIDLPAVALPVYQKYLSEEIAGRLIKFLATSAGQQMIQTVLEQEIRAQHTGATPADSRQQALEIIYSDKGVQQKILGKLTPEEMRKAESLGQEYIRLHSVIERMQKEYSQALIARQMELVHDITDKRPLQGLVSTASGTQFAFLRNMAKGRRSHEELASAQRDYQERATPHADANH